MNRTFYHYQIQDVATIKHQLLIWANQFTICCFLDNHNYRSAYHSYDCLLAVGALKIFSPQADFFSSLSAFTQTNKDWIFGHFNYDIKNKIENLQSNNPDYIGFPDAFLFVPEIVVLLQKNQLSIGVLNTDADAIMQEINQQSTILASLSKVKLTPRISKENYIDIITKLQQHILKGDCYEINFCQEFYAENISIDPVAAYLQLTQISPNPFSCYYQLEDKYLVCASPERYIKKQGNTIISQPIKGTWKRDNTNAANDVINQQQLYNSDKDKRENVMVVDLVRNDLSKICEEGSVYVEELFGVYTFPTVHQMISTIKGTLKKDIDFANILQATFPMGSMTGAPKKKVMELIEQYEHTKRGIFSGTVGYISPDSKFDFNVVIRSLTYNKTNKYISNMVGGGITYYSNPVNEYEECLLKAAAIKSIFEGS